jgi:Domain of unknown function (DUF4157)/OmpA family
MAPRAIHIGASLAKPQNAQRKAGAPMAKPAQALASAMPARVGALPWDFGRIPTFGTEQSVAVDPRVAIAAEKPNSRHQPKLKIGAVDDPQEREADQIADRVVRIPHPVVEGRTGDSLQRACACGGPGDGECEECQKKREGTVSRVATQSSASGTAPPIVNNVLRSSGQPLDPATRSFFEPRLGRDFSRIRVHTDAQASESALAVGASAYTVGRDIAFAAGHYAPGTNAGRKLLAHELVHTVQQASGPAYSAVQRQFQFDCRIDPFKIKDALGGNKSAALEIVNCCEKGVGPLPAGCSKDVVDAAKKILGGGGSKKTRCPPGFQSPASKGFEHLCCPDGTTPDPARCCPPERIPLRSLSPRCCPEGQVPDATQQNCFVPPTPTVCPPDEPSPLFGCLCFPPSRQNLRLGTCCPSGQEGSTGECKKEKPPASITPANPATLAPIEVRFVLDRPRSGGLDNPTSSLTSEGRRSLDNLVGMLKQNPSLKVQLTGKASPEGTADYNLSLSARRARMIVQAIEAEVGPGHVAGAPGSSVPAACATLSPGVFACGELGATGEADRQVAAQVFVAGTP